MDVKLGLITCSAPHGECHKGVGGKWFVAPKKSAAQIATLAKIDAMFCAFMNDKCMIPGTLFCVHVQKGGSMPRRRRSRSLAHKGTLAAAAKWRCYQEDAQQRDNRLALARLAHSLASNLQVPLHKHRSYQGSVMKAKQLNGHCRRGTVAVKPVEGGFLCYYLI